MRVRSVLLTATLLVACGSQPGDFGTVPSNSSDPAPVESTEPTVTQGFEAEFEAARARWAAAGMSSYSYRFLDDCGECDQLPEQTAVVWDGEVMDPLRRVTSVEEAFALIERSLAQGRDVEATFDRELGYPMDLWIDRDARAYDGGTHLVFSAVEPGVPGDPASLESHREARFRWDQAALDSYEYSSAVVCDCEYQVTMRTTVVDGTVAAFDYRTPEPSNISFSPLTINQMFDDVQGFLGGEDFPDEGIRVTGSALYDEQYGFPVWIGLDIEILDEAAADVDLPSRLVLTVSDLAPIVSDPAGEVERQRARWVSQGIDTYAFDIVFHDVGAGYFTDEFTVDVADGVIVSVVQNGYEFPPEDVEVPTIEEVFDWIVFLGETGSTVDVIYDEELGYPVLVVASKPDGTVDTISISLAR